MFFYKISFETIIIIICVFIKCEVVVAFRISWTAFKLRQSHMVFSLLTLQPSLSGEKKIRQEEHVVAIIQQMIWSKDPS